MATPADAGSSEGIELRIEPTARFVASASEDSGSSRGSPRAHQLDVIPLGLGYRLSDFFYAGGYFAFATAFQNYKSSPETPTISDATRAGLNVEGSVPFYGRHLVWLGLAGGVSVVNLRDPRPIAKSAFDVGVTGALQTGVSFYKDDFFAGPMIGVEAATVSAERIGTQSFDHSYVTWYFLAGLRAGVRFENPITPKRKP